MALKITEDCYGCGACEPVCPNQAIREGETIWIIDPERCTECVGFYASSKCVDVCPAYTCVPDESHRETREQLLAKFKKLHPDKTPA